MFLTDGAADLLNTTFGVNALSGSTKIGVATITADIPAASSSPARQQGPGSRRGDRPRSGHRIGRGRR